MLQMTKGCYVPLADKLCEQYSEKDGCFTANINGDKIEKLMREYISMQKEKVFFILELPANEADEKSSAKIPPTLCTRTFITWISLQQRKQTSCWTATATCS